MTIDLRFVTPLLLVLSAVASFGCRDAPLAANVRSNMSPVAHAGDMQVVPFDGSPVTVRLDGSTSTDADGKIVRYRWFSANAPADGGIGRAGPDPDDVVKPEVTLDSGVWMFTLFVFDNDGGISEPSTVTIMVGDEVAPEVTECSTNALQSISEECRLCACGLNDMCRMAIAGCNQACWDFYTCVQSECAEFVNDEAGLSNCVRTNCSAFFGGVGGYMPVEPCINRGECADVCAASVSM
jgi:hypothetical protein